MSLWQRYWFAPGGRYSAALVRMAIAASVLWSIRLMTEAGYVADPASAPVSLYRPVGILMLLGPGAPPSWLIEALTRAAWAATAAMLVGWRTRTSTVVSWCCAVALACYQVSFTAGWSHHNNLPFLAQLAFFGARGGDVWSVDAWWGRRRSAGRGGRFVDEVPGGYQWSLRLVQVAVSLMFFSAALSKWRFGHFTLAWALSDNLRHQLLTRFDWINLPRTEMAEWLLGDVWRYRTAAMLNLTAQTMPMAAALLVNRPRLRMLAGAFFVVETLALGVVMDLWNVHWLPLVLVFCDADRLRAWWLRRRGATGAEPGSATGSEPGSASGSGSGSGSETGSETGSGLETGTGSVTGSGSGPRSGLQPSVLPPRARAIGLFVALFLLYDVVVIFGLDQLPRTYPFSAFPMFGYVRAKRPYDRHQSYEMPGTSIEILSDKPPTEALQLWIDRHHTYRMLFKVTSLGRLEASMVSVVEALKREEPGAEVRGARLHFAVYQAPAYPAPAKLHRVRVGVMGEQRDGHLISAMGSVRQQGGTLIIKPRWTGMAPPADVTYEAIVDYDVEAKPLVVTPEGESLRAPRPQGGSVLVLAVIGGVRYVVGETGKRQW